MKKLITKSLCAICFIGMIVTLILNLILQMFYDMKDFRKLSEEYFWQIENVIAENDEKLMQVKEDFEVNCILRARAAAYITEQNPEILEDQKSCRKVAELLQVDELHFFDEEGMIFAGTHPEYYGIGIGSGEQIDFFAPMLENRELEMCQDIMPNTAEEKLMQYAAVWSPDGKVIVQVGMEPERVLQAIEGNNISDLFAMISCEQDTTFFAVDAESDEILGSTNMEYNGKTAASIGLQVSEVSDGLSCKYQEVDGKYQYCVAKESGSLILVQTCPVDALFAEIPLNMLSLFSYFVLLFLLLIVMSCSVLEKKIIRNIVNINKSLKMIELGNWHVTLSDNSTKEFAELCHYINSMVGSLISFPKKISMALELSEVPIGICEYEMEHHHLVATSRVKDILMLTDEEYDEFLRRPELIERKDSALFCKEKNLPFHVYSLNKDRNRYVRVEVFIYEKSKIIVLMDVTADVHEKQEIAFERDTDILTGLYNRRAFFRVMDHFMEKDEQDKAAALVLFDLDRLKRVNDIYGHVSGDKYITAFSKLLCDCEYENKIAARMGGDEFILFLYDCESKEEVEGVIRDVISHRDVEMVRLENGEEIALGFSAGWAFCPGEAMNYQDLVSLADARMYEDKKKRTGSVH